MDTFLYCCQALGAFVLVRYVYNILHGVYAFFLRQKQSPTKFGQWAIVTGATDGIGKAMAMELGQSKMNLVLISRSQEKLDNTAKEMLASCPGIQVKTLAMDCGQMVNASVREQAQKLISEVQDIGVLVNNVGVGSDFPMYFNELSDTKVGQFLNVNMACPTWMIRLVLPGMEQRQRGAIVNISSASAILPVPLLAQYGASKMYLEKLTLDLAAEYAPKGISIQCWTPLFVTTKLAKIRKPSFFTPTPATYARAALAQLGYDSHMSPYWPHAIQLAMVNVLPKFLVSKISFAQHAYIRKRGLKKLEKKSE